jgi:hypothetical protein
MKQFKYRALVKLDSAGDATQEPPLPATGGRVVVRAHHHDTHRNKMFGALVNVAHGETLHPANQSIQMTVTVSGDDAHDYLEPGDSFVLWRGHDIGHGVISRRLFFWADAP